MGTPPPETLLLVVCVPLCSLPPLAASQVCQFTTFCVCSDLQGSLIGVIQAFIRSSLVEFQGFTLEAPFFGVFSLYNCIVALFFFCAVCVQHGCVSIVSKHQTNPAQSLEMPFLLCYAS